MQTEYIQTLMLLINILSVMHFKYPVQCTSNQVIQKEQNMMKVCVCVLREIYIVIYSVKVQTASARCCCIFSYCQHLFILLKAVWMYYMCIAKRLCSDAEMASENSKGKIGIVGRWDVIVTLQMEVTTLMGVGCCYLDFTFI